MPAQTYGSESTGKRFGNTMRTMSDYIEIHGSDDSLSLLWMYIRSLVGSDMPEPLVKESDLGGAYALLWDTDLYEVWIEESGLDKNNTWYAKKKASTSTTSGKGNVLCCPTLALWLGRLCGEASCKDRQCTL